MEHKDFRFSFVYFVVVLLPHWVSHPLSADQVDMQVKDGLPAMWTGIGDQAVTVRGNPFLLGNFTRYAKDVSHQLLVFRSHCSHRIDVPVWDDQDVSRPGRMNIAKGSDLFILVDNRRFGFSGSDLTEDAILGHLTDFPQ